MIQPDSPVMGSAVRAIAEVIGSTGPNPGLEWRAHLLPVCGPQQDGVAPYCLGSILDASGTPQNLFAFPPSTTCQDAANALWPGDPAVALGELRLYNPWVAHNLDTGVEIVPVIVVVPTEPGQPVLDPTAYGSPLS